MLVSMFFFKANARGEISRDEFGRMKKDLQG